MILSQCSFNRRYLAALVGLFLILFLLSPANAVTFNGREYAQYSGQWFEVYANDTFRVGGTEIWVYFSATASENDIADLNEELDGEIIEINCLGTYLIQSTAYPEPDPLEFMESYLESEIVVKGKNSTYIRYCVWPNDPAVDDGCDYTQRYLFHPENDVYDNTINIEPAWNLTTGSPTVKVGVLDSGVLLQHSDLRENIVGWNVSRYGDEDEVGDNRPGYDECSHGTKISGVIAACTNNENQFAGIAGGWGENEGVELVFCQQGCDPRDPEVIRGLDYLINVAHVDIISLSFGMAPNDDYTALINAAWEEGILIVAASGNECSNEYAPVIFPANHPRVLGVGASGDNKRQGLSNYGPELDLTAPSGWTIADNNGGRLISYSTTTKQDGFNGPEVEVDPEDEDDLEEAEFSGTSCSAPQVAGVAALLLSQEPSLTVNDLFEILCLAAGKDDQEEIGYTLDWPTYPFGTWNEEMGYGELRAGEAVTHGRRLEVELPSGWSMISSNLIPYFTSDNGLDEETGIFLSFDELVDKITLLKDNEGRFWSPSNVFNTIPNWDYRQAYQICLSSAGSWVSLGARIEFGSEDWDIPVFEGWNLVSYFPSWTLDAPEAFISLTDSDLLVIAKDGEGRFYSPEYEFNNIPPMNQGVGYQIDVTSDATLVYPDEEGELPDGVGEEGKSAFLEPSYFEFTSRTGDFYPLLLTSIEVEGVVCARGDEVGVFTDENLCVGAAVYQGEGFTGLAVWADDTTTVAVDGFRIGDIFYLHYWDADNKLELAGDTLSIFGNVDAWEDIPHLTAHDLVIGNPIAVTPISFSLNQNFPNPFNASTSLRFDLPEAGSLTIEIFDMTGREVLSRCLTPRQAGRFIWSWNGCDNAGVLIPSGVYMCKCDFQGMSGLKTQEMIKMVTLK